MSTWIWPTDQQNTKLQMFISSSRQVIERVPRSSLAVGTAAMLDELETLLDQQYVASTRAEIDIIVRRVWPLVNEALARMNVITSQLQQFRKLAS